MIIGVDPGASGGIAWCLGDVVYVSKMPEGPEAMLCFFEDNFTDVANTWKIYSEKLSGVMPGNASGSVAKFARHLGHLDMIYAHLNKPTTFVAPVVWMKRVCPDRSRDKQERKREIKAKMQELYPDILVTLWNADALGIMTYGRMIE